MLKTYNELGPFDYNKKISPYLFLSEIHTRGPIELENGDKYLGHWTKDGLRHGPGRMVFKCGSEYEGYWHRDMATGWGRLIFNNGDAYEGDWRDNKAQGFGVFL